jgi:hypothetical protein
MDNEEEIITLLVGAGMTDDPYGQPITNVVQLTKRSREEVIAYVKHLEAVGKIKPKPKHFQAEQAGQESQVLTYKWIRVEDEWEESLGDVIARS